MMKFIPILFLFFSNFLFAAGFCTDYENVAEDTITYAAAGGIPDNLEDCEFAPDGYEVTIYKFGMCTQAPTAPTGAAAVDTTNCITIFESDAGTAFNLAVGVELDLAGEEKPANGTYTHAYVIMANTFGITHSQRFGGAPATMGGVAGGDGAVCISSANDAAMVWTNPIPCIERANSCSPRSGLCYVWRRPGNSDKNYRGVRYIWL